MTGCWIPKSFGECTGDRVRYSAEPSTLALVVVTMMMLEEVIESPSGIDKNPGLSNPYSMQQAMD